MSINLGSPIISNGLVASFDAASPRNYTLSEVEVLIVAGGGGGGRYGGGGGGGGVIYKTSYPVTPGTPITVTVGNGGAGHPGDSQTGGTGGNGQNSVFGNLTAIGGGGGGNYNQVGAQNAQAGASGGSSGGSGGNGNGSGTIQPSTQTQPGSPITGQGFSGGRQSTGYATGGGGGGGAGEPGFNGAPGGPGGRGGKGLPFNISGTTRYYAGGGGGGANNGYPATLKILGGLGGGGIGLSPSAPTATTYLADGETHSGGGGGGGADNLINGTVRAGNGGSGIVIVRYPGTQKATGGSTINYIDGYTIHVFTSSSTFTPTTTPANNGNINGLYDLSENNNHIRSVSHYPNQFTHYGTVGKGVDANNGVGFQINGNGTFIRQGYDQIYGDYKILRSDVVYRYDLGDNGCHYHGSTGSIPSGYYAYMECEYFVPSDMRNYGVNTTFLVFENYGASALGGGAGMPNLAKGFWQKVTALSGPTSGAGTQASFLYPGGCGPRLSDDSYLLMRNPRVEYRHTNSPILPTYVSNDGGGSINFDGTYGYLVKNNFPFPTDNFTISIWVKTSDTGCGLLSYATDSPGNDNEVLLYDNSVYIKGSSASSGFSWQTGSWVNVTITRDVNGAVNTYQNGSFVTTLNLTGGKITQGGSLGFAIEQDSAGIGEYGGGIDVGQSMTGRISTVQIYDRILSSTEVLSNYNSLRTRFGL